MQIKCFVNELFFCRLSESESQPVVWEAGFRPARSIIRIPRLVVVREARVFDKRIRICVFPRNACLSVARTPWWGHVSGVGARLHTEPATAATLLEVTFNDRCGRKGFNSLRFLMKSLLLRHNEHML